MLHLGWMAVHTSIWFFTGERFYCWIQMYWITRKITISYICIEEHMFSHHHKSLKKQSLQRQWSLAIEVWVLQSLFKLFLILSEYKHVIVRTPKKKWVVKIKMEYSKLINKVNYYIFCLMSALKTDFYCLLIVRRPYI